MSVFEFPNALLPFFQTFASLAIIAAGLGFLVYLFAIRSDESPSSYENRPKQNPRRVLIDPAPTLKSSAVGIAAAGGSLNKNSVGKVQLASAVAQEPGQSDPNNPPPVGTSKKPPSSEPPAKLPAPSTDLPVPVPASKPPNPAENTTSSVKPEAQVETKDGKAPEAKNQPPSQPNSATSQAPPNAAAASASAKESANKAGTNATAPSPNTAKAAAPQTPTPPISNANRTLKELGSFIQGALTPIFEGGVFASYSLDALRTESTGATSIRFTDDVSQTSRDRVVDSRYALGQRASIGIRGNFVGYRASYSNLVEETSRFDRPDYRELWPDLSSMTRIDMHVADIELTQRHTIKDVCIESFFGVRYAEYRGSDMAVGVGKFAKNLEAHAIAYSFRETEGIGPTFGLSAKRHLPWKFGCGMFEDCGVNDCGDLGWNCFWTLRGSVLRSKVMASAHTDSQLGVYSSDTGVQGIARSADKSYLDQSNEMNLFNGEFQLGLEYCRPLGFIPATASFRTSLVYQYWDTGSGVSTSESFASLRGNTPEFSGRVESLATSDNRFLDLFGMNLTMGLNY
jgi:outer membrane biosynthesis protein TonB